jgi:hypothetical protein
VTIFGIRKLFKFIEANAPLPKIEITDPLRNMIASIPWQCSKAQGPMEVAEAGRAKGPVRFQGQKSKTVRSARYKTPSSNVKCGFPSGEAKIREVIPMKMSECMKTSLGGMIGDSIEEERKQSCWNPTTSEFN